MEIDLKTKKRTKKAKKEVEEEEADMEEAAEEGAQKAEKPQVWNDQKEPLKEDEELDFDASAYEMLHRSSVEWPCLSVDTLIRERIGGPTGIMNQNTWFPS